MVVGIFSFFSCPYCGYYATLGVADPHPPFPVHFLCEGPGHHVISCINIFIRATSCTGKWFFIAF